MGSYLEVTVITEVNVKTLQRNKGGNINEYLRLKCEHVDLPFRRLCSCLIFPVIAMEMDIKICCRTNSCCLRIY